MRNLVRRILLILLVCGVAVGAVLAERSRPHVVRIDVGAPEDTTTLDGGWHGAERAWDLSGRWTSGVGAIAVPRAGRHATAVRAAVCAHPARGADQLRVTAGPFETTVRVLAPGCQVVDVPVREALPDGALTVGFASMTTTAAGDPRPLGVFVDWIEVEADGPVSIARSAGASVLLVALLAAVILTAWDVSAVATGTGPVWPALAAAAAGSVAWIAVDQLVPTVADLGRGAAWALGGPRCWRWSCGSPARPDAGRRRRRSRAVHGAAWAVAALVAAVAVLFREALLHGRVLSQGDLLFQVFPWHAAMPDGLVIGNRLLADIPLVFYPFLTQVADAFTTDTFPLWSTRLYAGHPFFASFQSAVLSPFTWIAVAVPLPWGTVAGAAARVLAGGLGALLFARRIGLGWIASAFCAVAFALNSFSIIWLEHPVSAVAAWLPWLLWGAEGVAEGAPAARDGRARRRGGAHRRRRPSRDGAEGARVRRPVRSGARRRQRAAGARGRLGLVRLHARPADQRRPGGAVRRVPAGEPDPRHACHADGQPVHASALVSPSAAVVPDFWGHPVSQDYVAHPNSIGVPANYAEQQTYPGVVTWVLACVGLATSPGADGASPSSPAPRCSPRRSPSARRASSSR